MSLVRSVPTGLVLVVATMPWNAGIAVLELEAELPIRLYAWFTNSAAPRIDCVLNIVPAE
jgi:hypothetical protein